MTADRQTVTVELAADEVLVALKRGEGYEDVHPELVSEDAIGDRWPEYRTIQPTVQAPAEGDEALAERLRDAYHSKTRIGHPMWKNLDTDRKEPWLAVARAARPNVQPKGMLTDEQADAIADAHRWDTREGRRAMLRAVQAQAPAPELLQSLIDIGTGKLRHLQMGACPDQIEGHETRDPDCPACQALVKAATQASAPAPEVPAGPRTEFVLNELRSALSAMTTFFGMDEDEASKPTFDKARQALNYAEIVMRPLEPWERQSLEDFRACVHRWHEKAVAKGYDGVEAMCDTALPYGTRDLRLVSASPAVQDGWQPIETAPKDGRKLILAYRNRNDKARTVMARWVTDDEAAETDADGVGLEGGWYECIDNWDEYSQVTIHEGEPSHWMPLPAAPGFDVPVQPMGDTQ